MTKRQCTLCNNEFDPLGKSFKSCAECRSLPAKEIARRRSYAHKLKNGQISNPGVGKGGMIRPGKDHPSYKTGIACDFNNVVRRIKEERRYCEKCSKDLKDATRYYWCVHHKDHDRTNNVESNFELLCKRCHQIEHECHLAFGKRNDYPEGE